MSTRPYNRELVHGTVQGYLYRGCRCELCRQAYRAYYGHRPLAEYNAEREPRHGTESRYTNRDCRCDACRAASAAAKQARRQTPGVKTHNRNGYTNGCRCEICREANTQYARARRDRLRAS